MKCSNYFINAQEAIEEGNLKLLKEIVFASNKEVVNQHDW